MELFKLLQGKLYGYFKIYQNVHKSYKDTLIGLNVTYVLVSLLLVMVTMQSTGLLTSLPVVGDIPTCGYFLLLLSVVGLIATSCNCARKNHKAILLFYGIGLFSIFIIQFSCSLAALSINEMDQKKLIITAWNEGITNDWSKVIEVESNFECSGLGIIIQNETLSGYLEYNMSTRADLQWSVNNHLLTDDWSTSTCGKSITTKGSACRTCFPKIQSEVKNGFIAAGGLGLFFSIPELLGVLIYYKSRHRILTDPIEISGTGSRIVYYGSWAWIIWILSILSIWIIYYSFSATIHFILEKILIIYSTEKVM